MFLATCHMPRYFNGFINGFNTTPERFLMVAALGK